ncbi:hypothetical protein Fot_21481 [Forsythia ovata]|uniref:Uncharacterized protein n=1 Tax=Forsythia ovata TaxID=205694 RepID=A0ABD1UUY7_9LAMI
MRQYTGVTTSSPCTLSHSILYDSIKLKDQNKNLDDTLSSVNGSRDGFHIQTPGGVVVLLYYMLRRRMSLAAAEEDFGCDEYSKSKSRSAKKRWPIGFVQPRNAWKSLGIA